MSVALGITGLSQRALDYADAMYAHGYAEGLEAGRKQAEASMQASWSPVAAHVREMGAGHRPPMGPTAAELAAARGQRQRADAIRADHTARGIAA